MEINNDITKKLEYLDKVLQKDIFSNPVREVQESIRNELVEFREIFIKNLDELEVTLDKRTEVINVDNSDVEKKNYRIMHLKQSFNEYEKKTEKQIEDLITENTKLKYRINILVDTINKKENQ